MILIEAVTESAVITSYPKFMSLGFKPEAIAIATAIDNLWHLSAFCIVCHLYFKLHTINLKKNFNNL